MLKSADSCGRGRRYRSFIYRGIAANEPWHFRITETAIRIQVLTREKRAILTIMPACCQILKDRPFFYPSTSLMQIPGATLS